MSLFVTRTVGIRGNVCLSHDVEKSKLQTDPDTGRKYPPTFWNRLLIAISDVLSDINIFIFAAHVSVLLVFRFLVTSYGNVP